MTETVFVHPSGTPVSTLPQAFQQTQALLPDTVAIRTVGDELVVTWREYADRVRRIAAGLAALGVERGHTVGLMLRNRPEFHLVDTAVMHLGAIPFSIYTTSPPNQIQYLFTNAENTIVVTEKEFLPAVKAAGDSLARVIVVDDDAEGCLSLDELESLGADTDFDFDSAWQAVQPDDVATLIYTSGTTGPPKGVELTHANVMAEFAATVGLVSLQPTDRLISYLPHAHIADRVTGHYANLVLGVPVTDVADLTTIAQALTDVRPTVWLGVPRVWHKIKSGIETQLGEASGVKRRLALWAIDTGVRAGREELAGSPLPPSLAVRRRVADRLVLAKVREALGLDQLRWGITGAAAAPESVGGATSNRPGATKIGSVGQALSGVEVSLAGDGELLIRGPSVMRGYRHQPEKTAEVIDADGWLHTGDIGTIDAQGFVTIVDRKKELIVNEAGKNLSPANIEMAIQPESPLIAQVVAIGDARPYVTALIALDPEAAFAHSGDARDVVKAAVAKGNAKLSRVEQVKRFLIVDTSWDPGGDELTPTMKLKRKPIAQKYAAEIERLYAATPGPDVVNV